MGSGSSSTTGATQAANAGLGCLDVPPALLGDGISISRIVNHEGRKQISNCGKMIACTLQCRSEAWDHGSMFNVHLEAICASSR
jgi:hypothetical protein